ncbi:hypothetical protein RJ639_047120 [Escallonia herrerae]|uniref:Apple domain-containing protein n=1 Tax=Escallonia herrerae TaxID=1293975 RepID=A0AA88W3I4_9ASTE|nr:hypothetical protein RJ639_047120 [Escallonia herrerae]
MMWNMSKRYRSTGVWQKQNQYFSYVPELNYIYRFNFSSDENETYFTYSIVNPAIVSRLVMTMSGQLNQQVSHRDYWRWESIFGLPKEQTEQEPTDLLRVFASVNIPSSKGKKDGFQKVSDVKLPADSTPHPAQSLKTCKSACMKNCSCKACAYISTGCSMWSGALLNMQQLRINDNNKQDTDDNKCMASGNRTLLNCLLVTKSIKREFTMVRAHPALANTSERSSLFVKKYAARGFDLEFMTVKLSSIFSTYSKTNKAVELLIGFQTSNVSATAPSTTLIAELSTYSSSSFARSDDEAGATSDGLRTTALPAAIAPITGSRDNTSTGKATLMQEAEHRGYEIAQANRVQQRPRRGCSWRFAGQRELNLADAGAIQLYIHWGLELNERKTRAWRRNWREAHSFIEAFTATREEDNKAYLTLRLCPLAQYLN